MYKYILVVLEGKLARGAEKRLYTLGLLAPTIGTWTFD